MKTESFYQSFRFTIIYVLSCASAGGKDIKNDSCLILEKLQLASAELQFFADQVKQGKNLMKTNKITPQMLS